MVHEEAIFLSKSIVFCSHARSPIYFIEALKEYKNIVGVQCSSYDIFTSGGCNRNRAYPILNDDLGTRGDFYFSTEDKAPYIKKGLPQEGNERKKDD